MRVIKTDRLVLSNFSEFDGSSFVELIHDYCSSENAQYDHKWPKSENEIIDILKYFCTGNDYLAVKNESESLLGFVNLTKEDCRKSIIYNLGYIFHSRYHGFGYAYEACYAYIQYAKNVLHAEEILSGTAKENSSSYKLLNKLGFKLINEGTCSFQNDKNDNPIEFTGCDFSLLF